ncbi:MAG TPA: cyclodeaminase/cyclohydrolase family protein, partial [Anaerolineales bacterium]|nr:cyclodeaminase/cyclohydrolase family protein [Anaerolineales bacterium]
ESLRNDLTQSIQLDSSAFESVMGAYKLPKETHEQQEIRRKTIEQATVLATQTPMSVAKKSMQVLELAEQVIRLGNVNALSDAASAACLAEAAIGSAAYNIRTNVKNLPANLGNPFISELAGIEKHTVELQARIRTILHDRGL